MGIYDEEDFEDIDLEDEDEDEDEETLKELNTDENGHVIEGRPRKRRSGDEYEDDFDFEERHPEAFGYNEDYED